jgi:hypothetical protein
MVQVFEKMSEDREYPHIKSHASNGLFGGTPDQQSA